MFKAFSVKIYTYTLIESNKNNLLSTFCLVVSMQRGARPVSAPVFSQAALMEAGIPMAPLDQPQTSTPIKTSRQQERKLEVTVEAVEPSKSQAEVKVNRCCLYVFVTLLHREKMLQYPCITGQLT